LIFFRRHVFFNAPKYNDTEVSSSLKAAIHMFLGVEEREEE